MNGAAYSGERLREAIRDAKRSGGPHQGFSINVRRQMGVFG